jgi:valyl-tRNA synthetase
MAKQQEMVEVFAEIETETEKALKLSDGVKTEWVPKSMVKLLAEGLYSMPDWLARKKGFTK